MDEKRRRIAEENSGIITSSGGSTPAASGDDRKALAFNVDFGNLPPSNYPKPTRQNVGNNAGPSGSGRDNHSAGDYSPSRNDEGEARTPERFIRPSGKMAPPSSNIARENSSSSSSSAMGDNEYSRYSEKGSQKGAGSVASVNSNNSAGEASTSRKKWGPPTALNELRFDFPTVGNDNHGARIDNNEADADVEGEGDFVGVIDGVVAAEEYNKAICEEEQVVLTRLEEQKQRQHLARQQAKEVCFFAISSQSVFIVCCIVPFRSSRSYVTNENSKARKSVVKSHHLSRALPILRKLAENSKRKWMLKMMKSSASRGV